MTSYIKEAYYAYFQSIIRYDLLFLETKKELQKKRVQKISMKDF